MQIIECKQTDKGSSNLKIQAGKQIAAVFCSNTQSPKREVKQLQNLWKNLKFRTKRHKALQKREIFATGGGKAVVASDEVADKIIAGE